MISHLRLIRGLSKAGKSTLIARLNWRHEPGRQKRIDLWWGGLQNNGDMMLLLAHLLSLNAEWTDSRILIRTVSRDDEEHRLQAESLADLLPRVRIPADTESLRLPDGQDITECIHQHSGDADIVFLGMATAASGAEAAQARKMRRLAEGLGTVVFVRNAGRFAGQLV